MSFFLNRGLECKHRSQEISGVTGNFGLGVQNEGGQRLIEFCQEKALVHSQHPLPTTHEDSIHGHHQMVNTEIRLIIFSAAENEAALYSQQKQNLELAVAQIISSLLPNAGSN